MLCKTKKKNTFVAEIACRSHFLFVICVRFKRKASDEVMRRGARVVEEARLESVYTPKAYHGFESRSLRKEKMKKQLKTIYNY